MHSSEMNQIQNAMNTWITQVIVGENICPFAKPVIDNNRLKMAILTDTRADLGFEANVELGLVRLVEEMNFLTQNPQTETTIILLPSGFNDFEDFLDLIEMANSVIEEFNLRGTYQIAHFHPNYQFDGLEYDDLANFTNRAPFPTLHIIREASIGKALNGVKSPESIPERNIRHARKLGADFWAKIKQLTP